MIGYADWVGALQALAWPLVIALAVVAIGLSPTARAFLARLASKVTNIQVGGVTIALSPEGATQAHETITDTFSRYRQAINARFDALARRYDVERLLENVVQTSVLQHLTDQAKRSYRVTLHVPDVLFDDALYQLIDYYPSGSGRGRAFSTRVGIIGRAWRRNLSQVEPNVSTNSADLIDEWAMTHREAADLGKGRQSFLCALLRNASQIPIAILYIDAMSPEAFDPDLTPEVLEQAASNAGLTGQLEVLCRDMRAIGPVVPIYTEI
jgi:hypothetical protein